MNIKGLRHIRTLYRSANRSVPRSRQQALVELTYLEHERARLQRQLEACSQDQKRTERRLRDAHRRVALLEQVLRREPAARRPLSADKRPGVGLPEAWTWREVPLEY